LQAVHTSQREKNKAFIRIKVIMIKVGGRVYKCVKCKRIITKIEDNIRCPYCGFRILAKMRPDTPKRVRAR
jgi:DNA-directed RNA polymerase subunit RPC12/RpoP